MSNRTIVILLIENLLKHGVQEFVLCPGGRNSPIVNILDQNEVAISYWFEERSAAFFALGRARVGMRPVAIVTTSGTAAGELLPAMMEAYYTSLPLIAITADRPRRYRGTNAPQTADQAGLFGTYAPIEFDLEGEETFSLEAWDGRSPIHINICLEEPASDDPPHFFSSAPQPFANAPPIASSNLLERFLNQVRSPLVIVNALNEQDRPAVENFLLRLNAPIYLEGVSGLCHLKSLSCLRIIEPCLEVHDGVLRIGGIPTHRIWRELEEDKKGLLTLSVSEHPFPGLSSASIIHTDIGPFFAAFCKDLCTQRFSNEIYSLQQELKISLQKLLDEEPLSEPSLIRSFSEKLPQSSQIFLGNSMPIRYWDLAARENGFSNILAARGLNGIDGQLSYFFGTCRPGLLNAALFGDLTALYDFAAGWAVYQKIITSPFVIAIINNQGGKIFSHRFKNVNIQNSHHLDFSCFAQFWKQPYQQFKELPKNLELTGIIEIQPDPFATTRFLEAWEAIIKKNLAVLLQMKESTDPINKRL